MNPVSSKALMRLACITLAAGMLAGRPADAATLVVPTSFATIQAAIDAAAAGDVVLIEPGSYAENIALRDGVDVRGREAARTILAPDNALVATVDIRGASGLRLSNLTIVDSSIAVDVTASNDIAISNVIFDGALDAAIDADLNSIVAVTNNVLVSNAVAIRRNTMQVEVTNNIFSDNLVTLTSPNNFINNNTNVQNNCWSNNADLVFSGVDTAYGIAFVIGDPLFVDPDGRDFHLRQDSPCIDAGLGNDAIDNTVADAGAYGGQFADARPYPLAPPVLDDTSTASPAAVNIAVSWQPNSSYLVTSTVLPGGYRLYYRQNGAGPPYDGTDAGGGTAPSPIDVGDVTAFTLENLSPAPPSATATVLKTANGYNESAVLTWEAVPGIESYRIRYGVASTTESVVDTGNVTSFTVTGLVNGTTYRFAVAALTQAVYHVSVSAVDSTQNANESVLSDDASIAIGDVSEGPLSNELTAVPEVVVPYPALPDKSGCFIATAAYGADWTAEVQALRDFRDRYLLTNRAGRWFVAQYYHYSPPIADWLRERDAMRMLTRWLLTPLVAFAMFMVESTAAAKIEVAALLLALGSMIALRRRRPSR